MPRSRFRPRITVRRLMVVVVLMGLVFAYVDRYRHYRSLAEHHRVQAMQSPSAKHTPGGGYFSSSPGWMVEGHLQKSIDYDEAAPYPWIWVDPEVKPGDAESFDRGFEVSSP